MPLSMKQEHLSDMDENNKKLQALCKQMAQTLEILSKEKNLIAVEYHLKKIDYALSRIQYKLKLDSISRSNMSNLNLNTEAENGNQ